MVNGRSMFLSTLKGKVVAVQFILTTCPHCQQACQMMERMYKKYGAKGLLPVAVAINPLALAAVPKFIQEFQITYPVGACSNETAMEWLQHPMMIRMMMPQVAFIDRQMTVVSQHSGDSPFLGGNSEANATKEIEALLNAGAGKAPAKGAPKTGAKSPSKKT
jgi:thiol-disulfide isomerase/thioredoxin